MRFSKITTFVALFSILSISCQQDNQTENQDNLARTLDYTSTVHFISNDGEVKQSVRTAVAADEESRSAGLMNVYELDEMDGMIFIFDNDAPRSFWMASTPLSLDIIFVNSDFEIVRIHRNTAPYSHESIQSEAPAKYVVEVNSGFTVRHDITEGMSIRIEN